MSVTAGSLELVGEEHRAGASGAVRAWHCPRSAFAGTCCAQAGSDGSLVAVQLASEMALLSSVLEKREFPLHQWMAMQSQSMGSNLPTDVFFPWEN